MIRTHKIRLNPDPAQETYFYKAAGTARFAYNWAVAQWRASGGEKPSAKQLKKQFNAQKPDWTYEVTKCAAEGAFMDFAKAVNKHLKEGAGEPQFKSRNRGHFSFYLANDKFWVSGHWITIPKLGRVNMAEKLRLHGKIMSARIVRTGQHWYASISVEMPDKRIAPKAEAVGVDVGILHLATLSDGIVFDNERPLKHHLPRLAKLQRVLARKEKGSCNYEKIKAKIRHLHARIRHIRDDILHKLTTFIARYYGFVTTEDLHIEGMMKNHHLAQALQDAALRRLLTLLEYKVADRHGSFVKVDRFFASSKTCSNPDCAGRCEDLTLGDREFVCPECGLRLDRDLNASINILYESLRLMYNTHPSGSGYDGRKQPPQTGYNLNISSVLDGGIHFCISER
ncbi:MAG: transposase [Chloroflexi bacterium]|nr:transposase [Chloroflexota bacterium]